MFYRALCFSCRSRWNKSYLRNKWIFQKFCEFLCCLIDHSSVICSYIRKTADLKPCQRPENGIPLRLVPPVGSWQNCFPCMRDRRRVCPFFIQHQRRFCFSDLCASVIKKTGRILWCKLSYKKKIRKLKQQLINLWRTEAMNFLSARREMISRC